MSSSSTVCPKLRFVRLSSNAIIPSRGSKESAGLDLYAAHSCIIPAKDKFLISTDLQIALPKGSYGRIAPRSGLAVKNFIDIGAGVIDADYRGPVMVLLFNFGNVDYQVKRGDKIAQLICEQILTPDLIECVSLEDSTERGEKGFGSTGK